MKNYSLNDNLQNHRYACENVNEVVKKKLKTTSDQNNYSLQNYVVGILQKAFDRTKCKVKENLKRYQGYDNNTCDKSFLVKEGEKVLKEFLSEINYLENVHDNHIWNQKGSGKNGNSIRLKKERNTNMYELENSENFGEMVPQYVTALQERSSLNDQMITRVDNEMLEDEHMRERNISYSMKPMILDLNSKSEEEKSPIRNGSFMDFTSKNNAIVIDGNISINGIISVNGIFSVNGNINVNGNISINGKVNVKGNNENYIKISEERIKTEKNVSSSPTERKRRDKNDRLDISENGNFSNGLLENTGNIDTIKRQNEGNESDRNSRKPRRRSSRKSIGTVRSFNNSTEFSDMCLVKEEYHHMEKKIHFTTQEKMLDSIENGSRKKNNITNGESRNLSNRYIKYFGKEQIGNDSVISLITSDESDSSTKKIFKGNSKVPMKKVKSSEQNINRDDKSISQEKIMQDIPKNIKDFVICKQEDPQAIENNNPISEENINMYTINLHDRHIQKRKKKDTHHNVTKKKIDRVSKNSNLMKEGNSTTVNSNNVTNHYEEISTNNGTSDIILKKEETDLKKTNMDTLHEEAPVYKKDIENLESLGTDIFTEEKDKKVSSSHGACNNISKKSRRLKKPSSNFHKLSDTCQSVTVKSDHNTTSYNVNQSNSESKYGINNQVNSDSPDHLKKYLANLYDAQTILNQYCMVKKEKPEKKEDD